MTGAVDAHWLEQTEGEVPAGNQWLSAGEMSCLAGLRFDKRRSDWRLGRWTAKRALASCLNLPADIHSLQEIEIRAAPSGAPEVFLFNQKAAVSLSISHRAGNALCVVGFSGANLGCDLELVESRDPSFITDFFTTDEQTLVERAPLNERPMLATLLWSAKESALKALHEGLRLDTTLLDVHPANGAELVKYSQDDLAGWSPLSVRFNNECILRGWWRCACDIVRTVVFDSSR